MTEALLAGLLAGYGIAMPVGAISALIVTLSARASPPVALSGAMGAGTADGLYALLAVLSGPWIASILEPLARPMQWIAVAALVAIAVGGIVRVLRDYHRPLFAPRTEVSTPLRTYFGLLGLTALNPLTIVYFMALVVGNQSITWSLTHGVTFTAAAFLASASWQIFLALCGALIGTALASEKGRLGTGLVGNFVILGLGFRLLWQAL